ncbi:MAG TPA: zinc ribbon domain-containing protein [Deltaproteobacteria bacterium]|nr:zinc ribbon domain-containing protein [Deltaproteobacteria bacterium]
MPLYEYQCNDCNEIIEVMQKFSDDPLRECTKCGGTVEKLISQSSFVLKGTGWYATDYANKKGADRSKDSSDKKPECATCPSSSTC